MVRRLYIILLALHPARFRYRFAFEMLAIYDEASTHGSRLALLADGVGSLVRQRVHPYRPEAAAAVTAGAGAPCFHSLDSSLPNRRYLTTGATLTLVLFSVLTATIGRDRWHPRIQLGAFLPRPSVVEAYRDSFEPSQPATEVRVRPAPLERVDPPYSFGVLDRDGNLMLSTAEMTNAPATLRTLDRDKYGNLSPPLPYLMLAVLDQDRDGIISSAEIRRSAIVLRGFDVTRDGTLVLEEAYAAAESRR